MFAVVDGPFSLFKKTAGTSQESLIPAKIYCRPPPELKSEMTKEEDRLTFKIIVWEKSSL